MSVLLVSILAVLWLCVSVWTGVDASENSSHGALLWGLTVLFGGIAGLLLYVNIGRDEVDTPSRAAVRAPDLVECPNCRAREDAAREVCRFCEEPLSRS